MKYSSPFLLLSIITILLFFSCAKQTNLTKEFACKSSHQLQQLEAVDDFNKSFTISLPKYWNTKLYYDNTQSEIFSADTIKNLTESYIMDFAMVLSNIEISKELQKKVQQKSMDNALETNKDSFHSFKGYDAYAYLGKGSSMGYVFYVFQYYIKINEEQYMQIKTEFYGEDNFDSRLCEALSLIETIKIH